jgi:hypothetical protein
MDLHPTPSSCEHPCARGLIRGTVEKLSRPSLTRFGREAGNQRTLLLDSGVLCSRVVREV